MNIVLRRSGMLAAFLCLCALGAVAQKANAGSTSESADAWISKATPYGTWNTSIEPEVRSQRDIFWDKASMSSVPLTEEGSVRVVGGSFDLSADPGELSIVPDRAVVTASFTSFHSVMSVSGRALYTEILLKVDRVFEDSTGANYSLNKRDITLIIYGGAVTLEDGRFFAVDNPDARPDLFIQPGRKYLFVLRYHKLGDFFGLCDSWDISGDKVKASSVRALYFAGTGHSALNEVPVKEIGSVVTRQLQMQDMKAAGSYR